MEMLKQSLIDRLCAIYDLGTSQGVPGPVRGGLLHRIWRLTTTRGTFALKQLNPAILRGPGMDTSYRLSERIAGDLAARGIPAIAALSPAGNPLARIGDDFFFVYAWVDGITLSTGDAAGAEQAALMGELLAHIHAQNLRYLDHPALAWKHFEDEHWDMLTFQAADQRLPWAYPVRAALPRLHEWSRLYEQAGEILQQTLVISHRDLDQTNVIWRDPSTPALIDWEAAGPINPTMELLGLALDWSRQADSKPREESFAATIAGYIQAGGVIREPLAPAFHGFMGTQLGWLLFNMRRSLGEAASSEEERQSGIQETSRALTALHATASNIDSCLEILRRVQRENA